MTYIVTLQFIDYLSIYTEGVLKYVHNNAYFKDGTHLNSHGANEFTRDLIEELKKQEVFKGL